MEHTIPTVCGRAVLVRPCVGSAAVQLAIIGKRGGMLEAASLDLIQLPSLIGSLERMVELLERTKRDQVGRERASLLERLAEAEAAAKATHCAKGHALTVANTYRRAARKACRRCRREENVWWRKEKGLR